MTEHKIQNYFLAFSGQRLAYSFLYYPLSALRYTLIFLFCILNFVGCAAQKGSLISNTPPSQAIPKVPGMYHPVRQGETLWRISKEYGIAMENLVSINRLPDASRLEEGQLIFIPSQARVVNVPLDEFIWPVKGKIISFFGIQNNGMLNKGIDIKAQSGGLVVASKSGKVVFVDKYLRGYGNTIIIDHLDGFKTVYAYNADILCSVGQAINKGEKIATVGSGGRSDEPALHFEIRKSSYPQNPLHYLP